jgi:hypothetical protein
MGQETPCILRLGRKRSSGEALLETESIIFRGETRQVFPFARMKSLAASDGRLAFEFDGSSVSLEVGARAAVWLDKIKHPKSVMDKLGVKPGMTVALLGLDDGAFAKDLAAQAGKVTSRVAKDAALVFLGATAPKDLSQLVAIEKAMPRAGAVWVVWPKGRKELREDHVRGAALGAGLVDVKVVAFSATHSALKLVIPLAKR